MKLTLSLSPLSGYTQKHRDRCFKMSYIIFNRQTIWNTLLLSIANFKWKQKALWSGAHPWHFLCFLHLSMTDNNLISLHTAVTYSIKVPGIRVHFHKIFFVRIRKWANYLNTKTPQCTVDPQSRQKYPHLGCLSTEKCLMVSDLSGTDRSTQPLLSHHLDECFTFVNQ